MIGGTGRALRRIVVSLTVIVLLAGGFFIYFLQSQESSRVPSTALSTALTTSTSSSPIGVTPSYTASSATASNASSGLRLELYVTNKQGAVNITADEFNTLSSTNNVTAADPLRFPSAIINAYSGCGNVAIFNGWTSELGGPVIFALFQGHYDEANYTTGQPLILYNTTYALTGCPGYHIAYFSFRPLSSQVSAYSSEAATRPSFDTSGISWMVKGYWTGGQDRGGPAVFHQLSGEYSGEYTVVALDEWGKAEVLHLTL